MDKAIETVLNGGEGVESLAPYRNDALTTSAMCVLLDAPTTIQWVLVLRFFTDSNRETFKLSPGIVARARDAADFGHTDSVQYEAECFLWNLFASAENRWG